VEETLEIGMGSISKGESGQVGKFVGILARGRDCDGSRPVVVEVTQFVGDPLEFVSVQRSNIMDHNEGARTDRPLASSSRNQEKVIPGKEGGNGKGRVRTE